MDELQDAISQCASGKACDEVGAVMEMFKVCPATVLQVLLDLFNHIVSSGCTPSSWSRTRFKMLAKHTGAKLPSDFRPIASLRILYKLFARILYTTPVLNNRFLHNKRGNVYKKSILEQIYGRKCTYPRCQEIAFADKICSNHWTMSPNFDPEVKSSGESTRQSFMVFVHVLFLIILLF